MGQMVGLQVEVLKVALIVQRSGRNFADGVVVQRQPEQLLQRLNRRLGKPRPGVPEWDLETLQGGRHVGEGLRVDIFEGVEGQRQFPQLGTASEGVRGQRTQQVIPQNERVQIFRPITAEVARLQTLNCIVADVEMR